MWGHGRKRKTSSPPAPTGAETAQEMRRAADSFVEIAHLRGYEFDWNPARVDQLDAYCDQCMADLPPESDLQGIALTVGAYLGEMLLRNGGGHWTYSTEMNTAGVALANGLLGYPLNKVMKRLRKGSEHSLEAFYWYLLTREVPPDSILTVVEEHPT
jgi:hypothetical protein